MVAQIVVYGIIVGALYGLVAIGLALIFGIMKYMNIAHGSFIMIAGYLSFWLFSTLQVDPFVSIPIVLVAMFILGLIFYKLLLSPLIKFPEGPRMGNSMLITFGLIMVIDNSLIVIFTAWPKTIAASYATTTFNVLGVMLPLPGLAVLGITLVVILGLYVFLSKTYLGKSIRATSENWEAANLLGININRTYIISSGIALALAGIAGTSIALEYYVLPTGGMEWVLVAMIVLVLAGMGKIWEVFLAGILLGLIQQVSTFFIGGEYRTVVGLVIFVIIIILRPSGLFK